MYVSLLKLDLNQYSPDLKQQRYTLQERTYGFIVEIVKLVLEETLPDMVRIIRDNYDILFNQQQHLKMTPKTSETVRATVMLYLIYYLQINFIKARLKELQKLKRNWRTAKRRIRS